MIQSEKLAFRILVVFCAIAVISGILNIEVFVALALLVFGAGCVWLLKIDQDEQKKP